MRPMKMTGWLVLLLSVGAFAEEGKRLKVAVMPARAEPGVAQGTVNLLSEVIAADAMRSPRHELMTSADVNSVLSVERQRALMGCTDTSCMAEIGNALGVDQLLDVSVGGVGNLRVVVLRLIDARTARALRRETETVPDESGLVDGCHRATARLFDLEAAPAPRRGVKPGVFVLGGAGALGVAGLVLGLMANNDYQKFKADPFNDGLGNRARTQAIAADGLYAGALVAAGVSVVMLLTGNSAPAAGAAGGL